MIVKYYDGYINLYRLFYLTKTNREGTNALNIVNALKELGFSSEGVYMENKDIDNKDIKLPCIAHVILNKSYMHYIVIYKIDYKNKSLVIADPADKIKKISFNEFVKIWTGNLIFTHPLRKIEKQKNASFINYILKTFKSNKLLAINIFIISLLVTIYGLFSVFIIRSLLDNYTGNNYNNIVMFFALIFFMKAILDLFRVRVLICFKKIIDSEITITSFSNIIDLPYLYYKNHTSGEINSKVNDIENIKNFISKLFMSLFVDLLLLFISFVLLFSINKTLSLLIMLVFTFYSISLMMFKKTFLNYIENVRIKKALINSKMIEYINNFETIRSLKIEKNIKNNFKEEYDKYLDGVFHLEKSYSLQNLIRGLIDDYGFLMLMVVAIMLLRVNKIEMLDILVFSSMFYYFQVPLKSLFDLDFGYKEAASSYRKISAFNYHLEKENGLCLEKINSISVVDFSYKYKTDNLATLNFNINEKEKVIINGKSGTGKSTFLNCLFKNIKSTNNQILINDRCINDYSSKSIKEKITYISQDEKLFSDTIYNNVICSRSYGPKDVKRVSSMCLVDEIVSKSNLGYNYLIEEGGFNISSGEAARIVLARALIDTKDIIVIDEGFSNIDIEKERIILTNIINAYKNKIIILVTHRMSNTDLFDKVIEL